MKNINDPWRITLLVAILMLILHLTIVPIAWISAQIIDIAEKIGSTIRNRLSPRATA